jgi:hypothetical protein
MLPLMVPSASSPRTPVVEMSPETLSVLMRVPAGTVTW